MTDINEIEEQMEESEPVVVTDTGELETPEETQIYQGDQGTRVKESRWFQVITDIREIGEQIEESETVVVSSTGPLVAPNTGEQEDRGIRLKSNRWSQD